MLKIKQNMFIVEDDETKKWYKFKCDRKSSGDEYCVWGYSKGGYHSVYEVLSDEDGRCIFGDYYHSFCFNEKAREVVEILNYKMKQGINNGLFD